VRHPFDAGDRVEIVGISKPLYVRKMQLHYTLFSAWDGTWNSFLFFKQGDVSAALPVDNLPHTPFPGTIMSIPNHVLYHKEIYNVRRSNMMWDALYLHIDFETPSYKVTGEREVGKGR
jgi:small-conductance mechanosensitive channel